MVLLRFCCHTQTAQYFNGEALSVILYCNLILSIGNTGINLNGTTIGIVTNAVADEIFQYTL